MSLVGGRHARAPTRYARNDKLERRPVDDTYSKSDLFFYPGSAHRNINSVGSPDRDLENKSCSFTDREESGFCWCDVLLACCPWR